MPQSTIERLVVIGATGRIGSEVARLGVAYGIEVVGIARNVPPAVPEPWNRGVQWVGVDVTQPDALAEVDDASAIVCAGGVLPVDDLTRFRRVIWLGPELPLIASAATNEWIVAAPEQVDASPIDWDRWEPHGSAIRVEALGMALLRAALEEVVQPRLDHDDLVFLGDAVMLQRTS